MLRRHFQWFSCNEWLYFDILSVSLTANCAWQCCCHWKTSHTLAALHFWYDTIIMSNVLGAHWWCLLLSCFNFPVRDTATVVTIHDGCMNLDSTFIYTWWQYFNFARIFLLLHVFRLFQKLLILRRFFIIVFHVLGIFSVYSKSSSQLNSTALLLPCL